MTRPGTGFDSRACGTTPFLIFLCREPAGVPGQTSPSTRAECKGHTGAAQPRKPGSLPGLRSRPMGQYLLFCVLFLAPRKDGARRRVNAVAMRKAATHDIPDRRERAGVVQWQNTSLPCWERGSDSRHRIQGVSPEYLPFMFGSPEQTGRDGQHGPPNDSGRKHL